MFRAMIKIWHTITIFMLAFLFFSFLFYIGASPVSIEEFIGAKVTRAFDSTTSSANVPPNPISDIAAQLKAKENRLDQQETSLSKLQDSLFSQTDILKRWLYYIVPVVVTLFILVLMNFYFDYKERKLLQKLEDEEKEILEIEKKLEEKLEKK